MHRRSDRHPIAIRARLFEGLNADYCQRPTISDVRKVDTVFRLRIGYDPAKLAGVAAFERLPMQRIVYFLGPLGVSSACRSPMAYCTPARMCSSIGRIL